MSKALKSLSALLITAAVISAPAPYPANMTFAAASTAAAKQSSKTIAAIYIDEKQYASEKALAKASDCIFTGKIMTYSYKNTDSEPYTVYKIKVTKCNKGSNKLKNIKSDSTKTTYIRVEGGKTSDGTITAVNGMVKLKKGSSYKFYCTKTNNSFLSLTSYHQGIVKK